MIFSILVVVGFSIIALFAKPPGPGRGRMHQENWDDHEDGRN